MWRQILLISNILHGHSLIIFFCVCLRFGLLHPEKGIVWHAFPCYAFSFKKNHIMFFFISFRAFFFVHFFFFLFVCFLLGMAWLSPSICWGEYIFVCPFAMQIRERPEKLAGEMCAAFDMTSETRRSFIPPSLIRLPTTKHRSPQNHPEPNLRQPIFHCLNEISMQEQYLCRGHI